MAHQHHVFRVDFEGRARELITEAAIINPFNNRAVKVQKAVWDTGASSTAITSDIAKKLGLIPTGVTQVFTAGGIRTCNTYVITIRLPHDVGITGLPVTEADLGSCDMLIGMDVIALGDFTVQNKGGKTVFEFCLPPFDNKYDMMEKANTINKKIARNDLRNRPPKINPIPKK